MRATVLLPDRNTRGKDWSGAFAIEAARFLAVHGGVPAQVDVSRSLAERRLQVHQALEAARRDGPLDLIALLCHGWTDGIQLGYHTTDAPELARDLLRSAADGAAFVLYACGTEDCEDDSAGACSAPTGFAAALHAELRRQAGGLRFHLDAHAYTPGGGHCTSNPLVVRTEADGSMGWLVAPGSPAWPTWKAALRDREHSTLRLRYPRMTAAEITAELAGSRS